MRRIASLMAVLALIACSQTVFCQEANPKEHLKGAFRKPAQNGWIFVHLEGTPLRHGFPARIPFGPGNPGCGES